MTKYQVTIEGRNFAVQLDGKKERVGFFTTFFLERKQLEDVHSELRRLLKERVEQGSVRFVCSSFRPYYLISRVVIREDVQEEKGGFTFYRMSMVDSVIAFLKYIWLRFVCWVKGCNQYDEPEVYRGELTT